MVLIKWLREIDKKQSGITGLETAIILIAFVMVASVLSYVVLSSGMFSSQKAKEAIQEGLQQTSGAVDLRGSVLAQVQSGNVTNIYLTVGKVAGGKGIDFTDTSNGGNVVVVSYSDEYQQFASVNWTTSKLATRNDNDILDDGELFQLNVDVSVVNAGAQSTAQKIGAYHTFMLEVKPPDGAVLMIERTTPANLTSLVNLY